MTLALCIVSAMCGFVAGLVVILLSMNFGVKGMSRPRTVPIAPEDMK